MKLLGIDYGKKRVGFAIGDTTLGMAFGRDVLENNDELMGLLGVVCQEEEVEKVIVGLPKSSDDGDHMEREVKVFGDLLTEKLGLPVEYEDERMSSIRAESILRAQGFKEEGFRGKTDVLAAQGILQQWMDKTS